MCEAVYRSVAPKALIVYAGKSAAFRDGGPRRRVVGVAAEWGDGEALRVRTPDQFEATDVAAVDRIRPGRFLAGMMANHRAARRAHPLHRSSS